MRMPLVLLARPLAADTWAAHGGQCPPDWLQSAPHSPPCGVSGENTAALVADLLAGPQGMRTLLQPIVRLHDQTVVGYEALSRGPQGSVLESPDRLFAAASACGRTLDMELHSAALALQRTQGRLPPGCFLSVNLGPQALACAAQRLPLGGRQDVLLELTEHLPLDGALELSEAVSSLRAQNVGLALDDTGCGFADLDTARVLQPDIAKLCITVVRHAGQGGRSTQTSPAPWRNCTSWAAACWPRAWRRRRSMRRCAPAAWSWHRAGCMDALRPSIPRYKV